MNAYDGVSAADTSRRRRVNHDALDLSRLTADERYCAGPAGAKNAIIQGDNLEVLEVLQPRLAASVSCIYIDPPYNNQESYTHYKDALPHAEWLAQIEPRLQLLWSLLRHDGSLWVSIDDREMHYLRVMLDTICGRDSFVATIVWEHRISRENRRAFSHNHEYIVVYAKDQAAFRKARRRLPLTSDMLERYRNPDGDPRGPWQSISVNVQAGHGTKRQFYELIAPNGRRYSPPNGRCWAFTQERMQQEISKNNIWFGQSGTGVPRLKRFLRADDTGLTPETLWRADEVGTTSSAKKHLIEMFPSSPQFDTPKPEPLIARIIHIATSPGDLVLDAYLGSGTTAAVAHKMGRRYIGIERGREAAVLAARRLRHVFDGEQGGVSPAVAWTGGGGFRFFRLR